MTALIVVAVCVAVAALAGAAGAGTSPSPDSARSSVDAGSANKVTLVKSVPAANDTIAVMPDSLWLWFSEPVIVSLTRIRLQHNKSELAMRGAFQKAGDPMAPVAVAVSTKRGRGTYTVIYKTGGADRRAALGTYSFVVR